MKRRPRRGEAMPAAKTRAESLRLLLEGEILTHRARPGQKLDEEALATRFGLSRTPVREALKGLASNGLVELRPYQGAFVAQLTPILIIEMIEVMSVIEAACAKLAAKRHTVDDRQAILSAQAQCEEASVTINPIKFFALNALFHDCIYQASHNNFLQTQARTLTQRLEPYRRQISYHPGLIEKSNREHRKIIDAIFSMREADAESAMQDHLTALKDNISFVISAPTTP